MLGIIEIALGLAKAVLERMNIDLKRKYLEELNECENKLREIEATPYLDRDHAAFDFYYFKLCQCLRNITVDSGK